MLPTQTILYYYCSTAIYVFAFFSYSTNHHLITFESKEKLLSCVDISHFYYYKTKYN